jgi:signal peptide peptidase SppA
MNNLPRIASRVFNTPLMVDGRKAAAMLIGIGARFVDGGIELAGGFHPVHHTAFESGRPSMGTIGDRLGRRVMNKNRLTDFLDVVDNVAIIPVEGTLVHKGSWLDMDSGETSYQGIQTQVLAAARRPDVKGVVFEVDSYGGEVSGAFETADMIASLSAVKPTIAILTDSAYSAGYFMASAARQVIIPEQGGAGSIGVITLHQDLSKYLEMNGVKVTILASGKHKAEGNPFEALPQDVADRIRGELDLAREAFAKRVATYRGGRLTFEQAMATEADAFTGAEAVRLGLADAVGHGSDAFLAFVKAVNNRA